MNLRKTCAAQQVPGQPGQYSKTLQKEGKQERGRENRREREEQIGTIEQQHRSTEDSFPFNCFYTSVENCTFNTQMLFGLGRV